MEPRPAYLVKQGRREALDTVRRAVAQPGDPVVSDDNPLGLPLDANGQVPTLKLVTLQENRGLERHVQCNDFCRFLANREEYVQAFNRLPQPHQIEALLLQEEWKDQPDIVKKHYLRHPDYRWFRALQRAISEDRVDNTIKREATL